ERCIGDGDPRLTVVVLYIPNKQGPVNSSAGQFPTVRAKLQRTDLFFDSNYFLGCIEIRRVANALPRIIPGIQTLAVRRKMYIANVGLVTRDLLRWCFQV